MRQAASPVRWVETIRMMARLGRHAHRRVRPGQGARGHDQAHRAERASRSLLADRASLEAGARKCYELKARSRWSPAPRAASATRSREELGKAGRQGRRHRDQRRRARRRCRGDRQGAGRARRGAVRRARRSDAEGARRHRDPGEQRRHHARQPRAAHEGRGVGRGDRDQPARGVPPVARGDARHDEGALGPHHQHHLGGRRLRQPGPGELRRGEGGRGRHDASRSRASSAAATSR